MLKNRLRLQEQGAASADLDTLEEQLGQQLKQLDDDFEFLYQCNFGREFMSPLHQDRIGKIAVHQMRNRRGELVGVLSEEEKTNLCIPKGTLTPDERDIINRHVLTTLVMLEQLPWPKNMTNVPLIAGAHHERLDGKGYPMGLTKEQMSVQMRILAIADVFEALTAKDRPYRPGMSLMQALTILGKMSEENHIDPDLFRLFIREKIYLTYARKNLLPTQIDEVDEARIPGMAG